MFFAFGATALLTVTAIVTWMAVTDGVAVLPFLTSAAVSLGLAALYLWLGRGLLRFQPQVRTPALVLSAFGLLAVPLGTLLNLIVLYVLYDRRTRTVLSAEYAAVVAHTPDLHPKPKVWLYVLFVALFLGMVFLPIP